MGSTRSLQGKKKNALKVLDLYGLESETSYRLMNMVIGLQFSNNLEGMTI